MAKQIEMNPGEMFMVADRTILVTEHESVLGYTCKIGAPEENDQLVYFFTFTGRLNNSDKIDDVTVAMAPEDAAEFMNHILNGLEMLAKARKQLNGS